MFKFKTPSQRTMEAMSNAALTGIPCESEAIDKIRKLTSKEDAKITSSGNNSIFIALSSVDGDVIVPDQGGWHGFKQIAKFLNKDIITLKTDLGLINPKDLDDIEIKENSALIFTSFAGYTAEQDVKSIVKYCKNNSITTIEDASAGIGDGKNMLGKSSDIIIASTGSPKMINVGSGGFIATDDMEVFKKTSLPQKLSKTSQIVASGIDSEIDNVGKNLELTVNATMYLKKHIPNTIHANKRGINVIIRHDDAKAICWDLKKTLTTDRSGFITACPNYNRIKTKGIAIEIKNLDYSCLKKEYLDKILEELEIRNLL